MFWQPIDFHRIIDLDQKIVDQLERFLHEKESRLATQIVECHSSSFSGVRHFIVYSGRDIRQVAGGCRKV